MSHFEYDQSTIPEIYQRARALNPNILATFVERVLAHTVGMALKVILDIGCGTGRFCVPLYERLGGCVIGIDPSARMLGQAPRGAGLSYVRGSGEQLPVADRSVDLAFMSLAWHHLSNRPTAAKEITRVLRTGGVFCLRSSSFEGLDTCIYIRFFPQAKDILRGGLMSRAAGPREPKEAGLQVIAHEVIEQTTEKTLAGYMERIARRAQSDLARIPDDAFDCGLRALRAFAAEHPEAPGPSEELDLLVYRKT